MPFNEQVIKECKGHGNPIGAWARLQAERAAGSRQFYTIDRDRTYVNWAEVVRYAGGG